MIDTDRLDTADSGLRDTIESSVATHDPGGPDTEALVGYAREDHARSIKKRNDESTPADRSDRLRRSIRDSINATKLKAAQPEKPKTGAEAPIGPPQSWSLDAKAEFKNLPHDVRMATIREQAAFKNAVGPIAERYAEFEKTVSPFRQLYAQHGLSDAQAVGNALGWARELAGPNKHNAMLGLMQQTGIGLQELVNMAYGQPAPPLHEQQQYQQMAAQQDPETIRATQTLQQFSRDKPHFDQVRHSMGVMLTVAGHNYAKPNGDVDLDKCYRDAVAAAGLSGSSSRSKRNAAVSPRGGSPAGKVERDGGKRSSGIRNSIVSAFRESRGQD